MKPDLTWAEIEAQWRECFGEPPPIRASVRLMRKVIRAALADGYGSGRDCQRTPACPATGG